MNCFVCGGQSIVGTLSQDYVTALCVEQSLWVNYVQYYVTVQGCMLREDSNTNLE